MGIKVHGILGYDLFKNFIVSINYANQTISFFNPSDFRKKLWFYHEMDMFVENTKPYIYQEILLADSTRLEAKLMIDTGASHSLMLHQNSDVSIELPAVSIRDILGAGIAGEIEGYVGRIKKLKMNNKFEFEDVIARFPDEGSYKDVILNTNRNGTIGGGILKRFNVYFDYQNDKVYLRRNKFYKEEFSYDMSGISVAAKGELYLRPYYVIEKIRPNTPASDAGLKVDDVILRMNGNYGIDLNLNKINNLLTKKPGKRIKLKIKRGEETLQVEFLLEKFI
jgi:hypothetical protein